MHFFGDDGQPKDLRLWSMRIQARKLTPAELQAAQAARTIAIQARRAEHYQANQARIAALAARGGRSRMAERWVRRAFARRNAPKPPPPALTDAQIVAQMEIRPPPGVTAR